jgi:hypothetical protein
MQRFRKKDPIKYLPAESYDKYTLKRTDKTDIYGVLLRMRSYLSTYGSTARCWTWSPFQFLNLF